MRLIVYPFLLGYDYLLLSYLFVNLLCKRNAFSLIICYENSLFTPRKVVKNCDIKLVIIDLMPFQRHDTTRLNLEVRSIILFARGTRRRCQGLIDWTRSTPISSRAEGSIDSIESQLFTVLCARRHSVSLGKKKSFFFCEKRTTPINAISKINHQRNGTGTTKPLSTVH